jgi:hypothetical protein
VLSQCSVLVSSSKIRKRGDKLFFPKIYVRFMAVLLSSGHHFPHAASKIFEKAIS